MLDVDGREVGSDVATASFLRSLDLKGMGLPFGMYEKPLAFHFKEKARS